MKTHRIAHGTPGYQPAYLANGLVGLRVGQIPMPQGTALVNGFVGLSPEKGHEEYAEAPYPVGADIALEGVWLSERPDLAGLQGQEYDFACGELRSRFAYSVKGITAAVEVLTFCSRTQPTLTLQEIVVTVDRPCSLTMQAHVDQRGLSGTLGYRCMPGKYADAILRWDARAGLSTVGAAYASEFIGEGLERRRRNDYGHEEDLELTQYFIAAQPDKHYVLRQIGSLVPSLMHGEPHWQASRQVGIGLWHGFDKLRADNRAAWAELWKGRPVLHGAGERWQDISDSCYLYLHSSVSPSTPCSVAPFGLSRRCEYSGHVFWDYETFMYPAVLLTAPEAARATMEYRSRLLPMARFNAQLNGYRGVQFPWQSGNAGFEVTPFYAGAAGGATEQHVNLDVAFAMIQYVHATGDNLFFRQHAWPVVQGVAEWIASRVTKTARGYEIRHITGIDEGRDNVHNNSFTNALSIVILREAATLARRFGSVPPPQWSDIAENMFLPIDPQTKALLKHEGYRYEGGVCVPETMNLYFPYGYTHSPEVDEATYRFHLGLAHTYVGYPMESANYAVWACRKGERELALSLLEEGTAARIVEPYLQMLECAPRFGNPQQHTYFLTGAGALLTALLLGFTGVHLDAGEPQGWARHPVVLPEGWEALEVERIWARGEPMRLVARHGAHRAQIEHGA